VTDRSPHLTAGDGQTRFLELYTRHRPQVSAYLAAVLCGWADVDEVLQETSLVLWAKFGDYRDGTSFPAWACAVALRIALRYRRRRARDRLRFGPAFEEAAAAAAAHTDLLDARRDALTECLGKLAPADRQLLERCYAERGEVSRAAAEAGRSAKSVYHSLARIRRALHECDGRVVRNEDRTG
jgi:RNA polymerase sigma-70 factor (ECF subfamily)